MIHDASLSKMWWRWSRAGSRECAGGFSHGGSPRTRTVYLPAGDEGNCRDLQ
jgi:hypothetical protein